jgi:DNA-binding HxlR family transcriptional regulator
MPPRTSYSLTRAGRGLQQVIDAIDHWGKEHLQAQMDAKRLAAGSYVAATSGGS